MSGDNVYSYVLIQTKSGSANKLKTHWYRGIPNLNLSDELLFGTVSDQLLNCIFALVLKIRENTGTRDATLFLELYSDLSLTLVNSNVTTGRPEVRLVVN